ncbi:MAG: hypothetical protein ACN6OX_01000, partial [Pseudomonas sp.]
ADAWCRRIEPKPSPLIQIGKDIDDRPGALARGMYLRGVIEQSRPFYANARRCIGGADGGVGSV